jgi:hypothetical protein
MTTKIRSVTSHLLEVDGLELELTHRPESEVTIRKTESSIIVGYLVQDSDCANPLEDDGMGSIRSLNRRHINSIDYDEAVAILKSDKDAVALSYFEHGRCLWGVAGTMDGMPDFNWDGTSFAGVWIPDDCVRESFTKGKTSRKQWMREQAAVACKEYTNWSNGDVFGVCVDTFNSEGEQIEDDACWGYIGSEYAESVLKEQVEGGAR